MKNLILIVAGLLLMLIVPLEKMVGEKYESGSIVCSMAGDNDLIGESDDMLSSDILYDSDAITLLSTYDCGNDDVVPCRMNHWGRQFRAFASRLQLRCHSIVLHVKKITALLSVYLTTLINHISQFYSSLHSLCWQYAADCYVFAFRQILI